MEKAENSIPHERLDNWRLEDGKGKNGTKEVEVEREGR